MKDQARLRRLIRKIVKEELEKIQHEHFEPTPSQEFEEPEWRMFDEIDFESPHTSDTSFDSAKKRCSRALPGWSEPQAEPLDSPPIRLKKKRSR